MTVHLDISQLLLDPRRTGIQRAERELIRHWPGPAPLIPCRFDAATNTMRELPHAVLAAVCADAPPGGVEAERRRLAPFLAPGDAVRPERLLNPELFPDAARAEYYCTLTGTRAFWIVYDFLPWLSPSWFGLDAAQHLMPYLRALAATRNLAFISTHTRDDCARILRCRQDGPVIPMGGDGLQLERQHFDPARRAFVMLGAIEPRKNAAPAMRAFQLLWSEGVDAELVMIGAPAPDAMTERALLSAVTGDPRFRHLTDVPDHGVREALRTARALLFPSEGEGFGIPPVEALHAGIPVIVAADLPALAGPAAPGQLRLAPVTPHTIAAAIRTALNDTDAARLWAEAAGMVVPTWSDFAHRVAAWVQGR